MSVAGQPVLVVSAAVLYTQKPTTRVPAAAAADGLPRVAGYPGCCQTSWTVVSEAPAAGIAGPAGSAAAQGCSQESSRE